MGHNSFTQVCFLVFHKVVVYFLYFLSLLIVQSRFYAINGTCWHFTMKHQYLFLYINKLLSPPSKYFNKLVSWAKILGLSFYIFKCHFMTFNCIKNPLIFSYSINNISISSLVQLVI